MLELFIGAFCISFAPILVKAVTLGPTLTAAYRCVIAAVFLLPWLITALKKWRYLNAKERKLFGSWLLAAGFLFALDLALWHRTVDLLGAGLGTILANTQSLYMAGFGVLLFGEKLRARFVFCLLVAVFGVFLMLGIDTPTWIEPENLYWGLGFGLLTGLCYSSSMLCLRQAEIKAKAFNTQEKLAFFSLFTGAFLSVGVLFDEEWALPGPLDATFLVLLALVAQVLGWICITRGLAKVPVSKAGLILITQPVLASIMSAFFFAEMLNFTQAAGALLTLVAVYGGSLYKS